MPASSTSFTARQFRLGKWVNSGTCSISQNLIPGPSLQLTRGFRGVSMGPSENRLQPLHSQQRRRFPSLCLPSLGLGLARLGKRAFQHEFLFTVDPGQREMTDLLRYSVPFSFLRVCCETRPRGCSGQTPRPGRLRSGAPGPRFPTETSSVPHSSWRLRPASSSSCRQGQRWPTPLPPRAGTPTSSPQPAPTAPSPHQQPQLPLFSRPAG